MFVATIPSAYAWAARGKLALPEVVAFAAAMTLVGGTMVAWLVQTVIDRFHSYSHDDRLWSDNSFAATLVSVVIAGAVVTWITRTRLYVRQPKASD